MNDLLEFALEAHGGLELWNTMKIIKIEASITGAIWHVKGRPDVLKNVAVAIATQQEKVTMHFREENKTTVFEPNMITIQTGNSSEIVQYPNPKSAFIGHKSTTPWLDIHVAYFSGGTLLTYLTIPFLYTYPGFICEEIEPWYEDGEVWRRLKVIFPDDIASHTKEQVSYFGPDGLLRRHDYTVDILGGATGANYATNYQNINGIIFPTTSRVYAYQQETHKIIYKPLLVAIELSQIEIE